MVSEPIDESRKSLRQRATRRLIGTASSVVSRARLRAAALSDPRPAAVTDVLLMDAQQEAYNQLHQRFTERAGRGDDGLASALDALDAMWEGIRQLRGGAPAILLTLSSDDEVVQERRARFYLESTTLLEDAIRSVFATDLGQLAVPPQRMAVLVRVALEGLVVELAQARTAEDVSAVDQAYVDLRALFERFVLLGDAGPAIEAISMEPIPLPW